MANAHDGDRAWEEFQRQAVRFERLEVGQFFVRRFTRQPDETVEVWKKSSSSSAYCLQAAQPPAHFQVNDQMEASPSEQVIAVADPAAGLSRYTVIRQGETDRYFTAVLNLDCADEAAVQAALGGSVEYHSAPNVLYPLTAGSAICAAYKQLPAEGLVERLPFCTALIRSKGQRS